MGTGGAGRTATKKQRAAMFSFLGQRVILRRHRLARGRRVWFGVRWPSRRCSGRGEAGGELIGDMSHLRRL